jgi:hypothetical protein
MGPDLRPLMHLKTVDVQELLPVFGGVLIVRREEAKPAPSIRLGVFRMIGA